jgi:Ser/Thr protein kinase RdoA (MazF antagonist)
VGDAPEVPAGTSASPRDGAVRREEVLEALRRFGIAEARVRVVPRGSKRAPKFLVEHRGERLLLKRRRPNGGAASDVGAEIQAALAERGFRVPAIRRDLEGRSVAVVGGSAWELVEFVEGARYPRTVGAGSSAGAMLATLHRVLETMRTPGTRSASFHDSPLVRRTLEGVAEDAAASLHADRLRRVRRFADRYEQAAARVRPIWPEIPRSLLHGDFHPGNLLFEGDSVVAVLDWEAVREDASLAEFASAAFHFSLPSGLLAENAPPPEAARSPGSLRGRFRRRSRGARPGDRRTDDGGGDRGSGIPAGRGLRRRALRADPLRDRGDARLARVRGGVDRALDRAVEARVSLTFFTLAGRSHG